LVALAGVGGFLLVGLGIRVLAGRDGALDGSGAVAQHSGVLHAAVARHRR